MARSMFSDKQVWRDWVEVVREGWAVEGAWVRALRRDWVESISAMSCFLFIHEFFLSVSFSFQSIQFCMPWQARW